MWVSCYRLFVLLQLPLYIFPTYARSFWKNLIFSYSSLYSILKHQFNQWWLKSRQCRRLSVAFATSTIGISSHMNSCRQNSIIHFPAQALLIYSVLLRKEVIQPHLPIRLPCYDFTLIINPTFGCVLLAVRLQTSGVIDSHGVTGGVYKARERIHRGMLIRDY